MLVNVFMKSYFCAMLFTDLRCPMPISGNRFEIGADNSQTINETE